MRSLITVSLLLISITASFAQRASTRFDRERYRIPVVRHVLPNGLTLLVNEDHSAPIVSVNIWYHVGSRDEPRGRSGFAHLFEHFFFNGSEHHPHGFREAMDDLGANNRNGTTSTDRTNFFEDVPVSALERTLYLEADRMGFLEGNLSQAMLERERGVVKNEKLQNENQPYGGVNGVINATIYPAAHPYSWQTIGSLEDIDAASLDDIKEWYRTYYGPNNAVITLAGDITPQRALELVTKYFGDIPPGPSLTRLDDWVPRLDRNVRQTREERAPQARVYRVYHAPPWGDSSLAMLDLFASVLSGSKSGRLDRRLLYEKQLVTGISANVSDREIANRFMIIATVRPGGDPLEVEREIDRVVSELIASGPTVDELERAKSRALAGFIRTRERLVGRGHILNESMTFGGAPDAYLDLLESIARATPAAVKAASKLWVGDAHHYTLTVVPRRPLSAMDSTVDRTVLPSLGEPPNARFPDVQRATLGNGLRVMLLERHATPLVNVTLVIPSGHASDPFGSEGVASLAMSLLQEGTTTRDAFRIVDELDAIGAEISTTAGLDMSYVSMSALPMNMDASLAVFADIILRPAYAQASLDRVRATVLAQIAQQRSEPTGAAMRILPGILFGPRHVYGRPAGGIGYDSTVSSLTVQHLRDWHAASFRRDNATIVVTGDITMAQLVPALERALGSWKASGEPLPRAIPAPVGAPKRAVYVIDKPGAQQSVIVAAHTTSSSGQSDDLALETVMRTFGGIATSRLNRNLRLEKHWSYGAFGGVRNARGPRTVSVIAPVQADKTKESMVEIANEIRAIASARPITGEEFASTMRNATMRLPARFETLDDIERAAIELIAYELPDDHWTTYSQRVRTLDEAALAAAARAHVRPEEVVWIVVGDRARIEAGIRELGYGDITIVQNIP